MVRCELNQLQLNISKTKELLVDFRRSRSPATTLSIRGDMVEVLQEYKYLDVHLDNKLDWTRKSVVL